MPQYYFPTPGPLLSAVSYPVSSYFPFPKLSYRVRQILPRTLLAHCPLQEKHRGSSDGKSFAAVVYGEIYRKEAKITMGESQRFQKTENLKLVVTWSVMTTC